MTTGGDVTVDDGVVVVTLFFLHNCFCTFSNPKAVGQAHGPAAVALDSAAPVYTCPLLNNSNTCQYDASAAVKM